LKFCWLSTHIHIYTMREMRILFKKKENTI
jgi:hypothetical protein